MDQFFILYPSYVFALSPDLLMLNDIQRQSPEAVQVRRPLSSSVGDQSGLRKNQKNNQRIGKVRKLFRKIAPPKQICIYYYFQFAMREEVAIDF